MVNYQVINKKNKRYPKRLLEISNAPENLYVMGNVELLNKKSVAIIGSRACTEYGAMCSERFAKELSKAGVCVVSGLAIRNRYSSTQRSKIL